MKGHNTKFTLGPTKFAVGGFPPAVAGQSGLLPLLATLDPAVGEEVALYWVDATPFIHELAAVRPFRLLMNSGVFRSEHGPLMWLLFHVPDPEQQEQPFAMTECHVNPSDPQQVSLWRRLADQSHWHVFLLGAGEEVFGFFEFENTFAVDEALDVAAQVCRGSQVTDFMAAKQEFWDSITMEQLFEMIQKEQKGLKGKRKKKP